MSDHSSVRMEIGGKIKRADVEELIEIAANNWAGVDYDHEGNEETLAEEIEEIGAGAGQICPHTKRRKPLVLTGNEVSWGHFEELESFCRDKGLAYCTQCGASGAWGEGIDFWEPGMSGPEDYACIDDGTPVLAVGVIRKLLEEGTLREKLARLDYITRFDFPFEIVEPPADDRSDEDRYDERTHLSTETVYD